VTAVPHDPVTVVGPLQPTRAKPEYSTWPLALVQAITGMAPSAVTAGACPVVIVVPSTTKAVGADQPEPESVAQ